MKAKTLPKNKRSKHISNTYNNDHKENKLYMLPLVLILSILPLIMHLYVYDAGLSAFNWFPNSTTQYDIFLFYKQVFFLIISFIMLVIILLKIYSNRKVVKLLPLFIPLFTYGFLAFLSTIFSKYSSFGFKGVYEQFESIFVILGYCLVAYYAFIFIKSEEDMKLLLKYLLIGILIIVTLGILQAIGHDFFATELGKKLYIPRAYWNNLDAFEFTFGPKRVYMTLYNPNYVGVYVSLILPILTGLLLTEKKLKLIIPYAIAIIGLIVCLVGSQSKAGMIGLGVSFLFIVIFFRRYIFKNITITITIIVVTVLSLVTFKDTVVNIIKNTVSNIKILMTDKTEHPLSDIKTDEYVEITYNDNILKIKLDLSGNNATVLVKDVYGQDIPTSIDSETGVITITDERFPGFQVTPIVYDSILCTEVTIGSKDWIFSNQLGDGSYYYLNYYGRFDKIKKAESLLFTGYENFASGRGYIWSRTIPLLKNNIILGSGADTYITEYPHQDYVWRYHMGYDTQILTKPHSLYLQIGVQSGVISLLAFLMFYIMYFISSMKLYIKGRFDNIFKQAGAAIFIGILGYMITGITNDSTITVAPVAWALVGMGIACNYKVKAQEKSEIYSENK